MLQWKFMKIKAWFLGHRRSRSGSSNVSQHIHLESWANIHRPWDLSEVVLKALRNKFGKAFAKQQSVIKFFFLRWDYKVQFNLSRKIPYGVLTGAVRIAAPAFSGAAQFWSAGCHCSCPKQHHNSLDEVAQVLCELWSVASYSLMR